MKITDIRRNNLQLLQDTDFNGVQARLAARLKRTPAQISQWFAGYRTIREDTARDIEQKTGKPPGWLDVERAGAMPRPEGSARAVYDSAGGHRATPLRTGPSWPLTVLSSADWYGLSEDERMEIEAAMLASYAEIKRRRRESLEAEAAALRGKAAANG